MHQEKYTLTWHSYSDHLRNMMRELMMNEDYSDITLVTEDKKQIKANRNILGACSPFFNDILKQEKGSSTMMYLRGVQYSEMESIVQFIYLGEATFYEERTEEFLAVAKSLEINELCNAEVETNDEPDDEPSTTDPGTFTEDFKDSKIQIPQESQEIVVRGNGKYECEDCQTTYDKLFNLNRHKQSVHQGVRYTCEQCGREYTQQCQLNLHIQSKHEGIKFSCDQCGYQATKQNNLRRHKKNKHKIL